MPIHLIGAGSANQNQTALSGTQSGLAASKADASAHQGEPSPVDRFAALLAQGTKKLGTANGQISGDLSSTGSTSSSSLAGDLTELLKGLGLSDGDIQALIQNGDLSTSAAAFLAASDLGDVWTSTNLSSADLGTTGAGLSLGAVGSDLDALATHGALALSNDITFGATDGSHDDAISSLRLRGSAVAAGDAHSSQTHQGAWSGSPFGVNASGTADPLSTSADGLLGASKNQAATGENLVTDRMLSQTAAGGTLDTLPGAARSSVDQTTLQGSNTSASDITTQGTLATDSPLTNLSLASAQAELAHSNGTASLEDVSGTTGTNGDQQGTTGAHVAGTSAGPHSTNTIGLGAAGQGTSDLNTQDGTAQAATSSTATATGALSGSTGGAGNPNEQPINPALAPLNTSDFAKQPMEGMRSEGGTGLPQNSNGSVIMGSTSMTSDGMASGQQGGSSGQSSLGGQSALTSTLLPTAPQPLTQDVSFQSLMEASFTATTSGDVDPLLDVDQIVSGEFKTADPSQATTTTNKVDGRVGAFERLANAEIPSRTVAIAMMRGADRGNTHFEIRLDPPELGRVDIRMSVGRSGQVQAQLKFDRPETLELFQRDARALEKALSDAGLSADAADLEFSMQDQSDKAFADMFQQDNKPMSFANDNDALTAHETSSTDASSVQDVSYFTYDPNRLDMRI